jgi:hypothetical protein
MFLFDSEARLLKNLNSVLASDIPAVKVHATRLTRKQIETINLSQPFRPYDGRIKLPFRP